jgi:hypothetical protein
VAYLPEAMPNMPTKRADNQAVTMVVIMMMFLCDQD